MSDSIEIVMDIDSLEIFDVIDLDKNENMVDCIPEGNSEEKVSPYDDLDRVWLFHPLQIDCPFKKEFFIIYYDVVVCRILNLER